MIILRGIRETIGDKKGRMKPALFFTDDSSLSTRTIEQFDNT